MSAVVRVRIPVMVDSYGEWQASGASWRPNAGPALRANVVDVLRSDATLHWIEADVPVPTAPNPKTIRGIVA